MAKSKPVYFSKLIKAPPKPYSKPKRFKGPFSHSTKCCLTSKQWQQLHDWICEYYHEEHLGKIPLPISVCSLTQLIRGESTCDMLNPLYTLKLPELSFRRKLDENAVRQSVNRLCYSNGWTIGEQDQVIRGVLS